MGRVAENYEVWGGELLRRVGPEDGGFGIHPLPLPPAPRGSCFWHWKKNLSSLTPRVGVSAPKEGGAVFAARQEHIPALRVGASWGVVGSSGEGVCEDCGRLGDWGYRRRDGGGSPRSRVVTDLSCYCVRPQFQLNPWRVPESLFF